MCGTFSSEGAMRRQVALRTRADQALEAILLRRHECVLVGEERLSRWAVGASLYPPATESESLYTRCEKRLLVGT